MTPAENLYWYRVDRIISAFDGDTFRAELSLGFHMSAELIFRVAGIDTPEMGQPGALEARDYLRKRFADALPNSLTIRTYKGDKYGRWLAQIFIGDEHLNQTMIDLGYAVFYDGGPRGGQERVETSQKF